jgi:hypothetical protein
VLVQSPSRVFLGVNQWGNSPPNEWTHDHNYPSSSLLRRDLGEKHPCEIYPQIDEKIHDLFMDYVPSCGEQGFHTIVSVEVCPFVVKKKLL